MSLEKLKKELDTLANKLSLSKNLWQEVDTLGSAYPFNEYEYVISHLLSQKIIGLQDYKKMRANYISTAINLPLFDMAPRTFGESWGQSFIKSNCPGLLSPTTHIDEHFDGEYDLYLPHDGKNIKIEVKASRATDCSKDKKESPPNTRALAKGTKCKFDMNFQQIKVKCCDIFIFVIVWVDEIDILVLSSNEVKGNKYYNEKQHRGNVGEGQLHIKPNNLSKMCKYITTSLELKQLIISKIE